MLAALTSAGYGAGAVATSSGTSAPATCHDRPLSVTVHGAGGSWRGRRGEVQHDLLAGGEDQRDLGQRQAVGGAAGGQRAQGAVDQAGEVAVGREPDPLLALAGRAVRAAAAGERHQDAGEQQPATEQRALEVAALLGGGGGGGGRRG